MSRGEGRVSPPRGMADSPFEAVPHEGLRARMALRRMRQ
jgi:hypothetical protein